MTHPFPPSIGPIAPERNPPPHPEWYQPSRFKVSNISIGLTTLVTTSVDHNYVIGQEVRLIVPFYYGTYQLNGMQGFVISIPAANQVVIDIDSFGFNAYIASPSYNRDPPQILAIGDVNTGQKNISTGRFTPVSQLSVPGSFENISPTISG